ncbi:thioesterase domain-containing protein [Colwellia psychrerythraea]|nr:thioesterase domain-containing protein [Colwellia psychrerythraea]
MELKLKLPTLIELNKSTSTTNVFCLHTMGGGINVYNGFAEKMSEEAKFYGLEEPLIYDDFEYSSLPELAEYHVDTIKAVQETGPYTLIGYCSGGPIAYEVAYQLSLAGEQINKLVIIGSKLLSSLMGSNSDEKERYLFIKDYLLLKYMLNLERLDWPLLEDHKLKFVIDSIINEIKQQQGNEFIKDEKWVRKGIKALYFMRNALKKHSVSGSSFDVVLFDRYIAPEFNNRMMPWFDWDNITSGELDVIKGVKLKNQDDDINQPPYLDKTVNQLKIRLF